MEDKFRDWANSKSQTDEGWRKIESNLYFSADSDREAILLKKKRQYYQREIDTSYTPPLSTQSEASTPRAPSAPRTESSSSSGGSNSSSTSSSTSRQSGSKMMIALGYVELACHVVVVLCSALLLWSADFYYLALKASIVASALYGARTFGSPSLTKEYFGRIVADETFHYLFSSFILLSARPMLVALLPTACRSLIFSSRALSMVLPKFAPALHSRVDKYLKMVTERQNELGDWASQMEVLFFLVVLLQLIGPDRNLLLLFLWFQYLRVRYMISGSCQRAFMSVRMGADKIFLHPRCPALVTNIYHKVVGVLSNLGDQRRVQEASQVASKCTIM